MARNTQTTSLAEETLRPVSPPPCCKSSVCTLPTPASPTSALIFFLHKKTFATLRVHAVCSLSIFATWCSYTAARQRPSSWAFGEARIQVDFCSLPWSWPWPWSFLAYFNTYIYVGWWPLTPRHSAWMIRNSMLGSPFQYAEWSAGNRRVVISHLLKTQLSTLSPFVQYFQVTLE